MRRLLLVCLIGAWAMWLAMLAAAGFLQGDPTAERQSARVYVRNRGREVILRLDTSKGIGSPLPTMYIISIPTVNEFEADDQASTIKNHR